MAKVLELQLQHQSFQWIFRGWFPLKLTGLISLQSKWLSRVFSNTTVWKHQFFGAQPSLWSNYCIHTWILCNCLIWRAVVVKAPYGHYAVCPPCPASSGKSPPVTKSEGSFVFPCCINFSRVFDAFSHWCLMTECHCPWTVSWFSS